MKHVAAAWRARCWRRLAGPLAERGAKVEIAAQLPPVYGELPAPSPA